VITLTETPITAKKRTNAFPIQPSGPKPPSHRDVEKPLIRMLVYVLRMTDHVDVNPPLDWISPRVPSDEETLLICLRGVEPRVRAPH
jgi:hypothetical protein